MPSQTALSGANPISRRIAELSGCGGARSRGGARARLPCRALPCPACPPRPRKAAQGSAAPRRAKPGLGEHLPVGAAPKAGAGESRAAPGRRSAGAAAPAPPEEGRAGRQKPLGTGAEERLQPRPVCPRDSSPLVPTHDTAGDQRAPEIRTRLCWCRRRVT